MQAYAGHIAEKLEESETSEKSAVVALYDTHEEAEEAVRELQKSVDRGTISWHLVRYVRSLAGDARSAANPALEGAKSLSLTARAHRRTQPAAGAPADLVARHGLGQPSATDAMR